MLKVVLIVCAVFYFLILPVHAKSVAASNAEPRQPHRLQFDDYLQTVIKQQNQWFDQFYLDRFFRSSRDFSEDIEEIHKRILEALNHSPILSPAIRHVGQNPN